MLKFQPFLTLNKSTYQLTYNHPQHPLTNLLCIVQTTQPSFQKLMLNLQCQIQIQKQSEEYGIYISKQLFHNHHILYLDGKQSKQIEDKYLSFFEKIIITLSNKIVFGDRSDYTRLLSCIQNRNVDLIMFLQTKNETYKINSINDNRLEIGGSISMNNVLTSMKESNVNDDEFKDEIRSFFNYRLVKETKYFSNMSIVYEWIVLGINLRKQYLQFKSSMIDKAVSMFKKQQLQTLLSHLESLSTSCNCYEQYLIQTFKQEIVSKNNSLKQHLLEQIYQRYKIINATTYDQFKMQISVKFQLIKYSVDQYLTNSVHYANSILNRITMDFCQPLFASLKTQLEEEIETKECLTHEVDQQIIINDSLKKQIERLNRRIDDMSNIDEVLRNKENIIRDLQGKNDKLRSSQILLEGENIKKQNLIKHLEQKLKEKNQVEKKSFEEINKKNNQLSNLSKIYKQTQKDKQELTVNLKKKTDECNQIRKIFHSAHEAKSVFEKKAQSQQKCINQFHNRLQDLKEAEKAKANIVLNLNLRKHKQVQDKNVKLQHTINDQDKRIVFLNDENRKLKIQINYFQKMFNQTKEKAMPQPPLIIIQQNNEASTDRKRGRAAQRHPFGDVNEVKEEGEEWVNSSRKECQKSIGPLYKIQIQDERHKYF